MASVANMYPPPLPVDPSLDISWNNKTVYSHLDGLLSPNNGYDAQFSERPMLPGTPGETVNVPDNNRLPSIRETDSVTRWNEDPAAPWTGFRHTGAVGQSMMTPSYAGYTTQRPSQGLNVYGYRESPRSDASATTPGRYPLDSGYGTNRSVHSHSEGSMDHPDGSPVCQSDPMDLNGLDVNETIATCGAGSNGSHDDQYSSYDDGSNTSQRPRMATSMICPHEGCSHVSKNNSEFK